MFDYVHVISTDDDAVSWPKQIVEVLVQDCEQDLCLAHAHACITQHMPHITC